MSNTGAADLTVLGWIKAEIDASLRSATEWLEAESDPKQIEKCVHEVHRLGGALQIAGVLGLDQICDAIEGVLTSFGSMGDDQQARALVTRALEALGGHMDELLTGKPNRPMRLFTLYRELRQMQGHDKVSPADLFYPPLNARLPAAAHAATEPVDQMTKAARKLYQRGMLSWLRGDTHGLDAMLEAMVKMDSVQRAATGFWWVATAFFEALRSGAVAQDSHIKKICARVDVQLGRLEKESLSIADGLFRELLFYVGSSKVASARVEDIIRAFHLREHLAEEDPAHTAPDSGPRQQTHQLLRETKEAWSLYCEEGPEHLDAFTQKLQALAQSTRDGALTGVQHVVDGIGDALTAASFKSADDRALAVASALLVCEELLLDTHSEFDQAKVDQALTALGVATLNQAETAPAPQHSFDVALLPEIAKNLKQVEHHVSAYLKDETKKNELTQAQSFLQQVLNILEMSGANHAVVVVNHCLGLLRSWAQRAGSSHTHEQETFAQSLTALEFYLVARSRGEAHAESFVSPILTELGWKEPAQDTDFAPSAPQESASQSVEAELQRELRDTLALMDRWMRSNTSTLQQLEEQLKSIYQDAVLVADKQTEQSSARALALIQNARAEPIANLSQAINAMDQPAAQSAGEHPTDIPSDMEIAEVFLEEAREVLDSIAQARNACEANPADQESITTIRRGFHTLKGSSRMAGLSHMGEVAWSLERLLNHRIEQDTLPDAALLHLIHHAHEAFTRWVSTLQEQGRARIDGATLISNAQRMLAGQAPAAAPPAVAAAQAPANALSHGSSVSTTLFKVFQDEAEVHIQSLRQEQTLVAAGKAVRHDYMRAAHTLAGISRTLMVPALADLAQALEICLLHHLELDQLPSSDQVALYDETIDELKRMVGMVSNRQGAPSARADLIARLEHALSAQALNAKAALSAKPAPSAPTTLLDEDTLTGAPALVDLDAELREIFLQEALELTSELGSHLQIWRTDASDAGKGAAVARALHTFKGSARAAGAMILGELVHRIEEEVQRGIDQGNMTHARLDALLARFDRWYLAFDRELKLADAPVEAVDSKPDVKEDTTVGQVANMQLRVRADAVERLAQIAGELNIARARMSEQIRGARQSTLDLNDSVTRLRGQLREIEIQAESQMKARLTQLDERNSEFDPLEFDRFTRLQELSRFMAESLHDIGTVQHNLLRHFQDVDAVLISHARVNRELNRELTRIQTVAFASSNERLQRIMRQTCAELGKRATLEIKGAQVELDRRLLDRILPPLEHMIRNSLAHGIEDSEARRRAGKPDDGRVIISLRQEANQVVLEFSDDGAGLDLRRIRAKAQARQLISGSEALSDDEVRDLIFMAGFSTAEQVTEVSGRGVGMDVVRSVVTTLGGQVDVRSREREGTTFTLLLPLTLVVAQVLTVGVAGRRYAIPASLLQQVLRCDSERLAGMVASGSTSHRDVEFPFHSLASLLGEAGGSEARARNNIVLLLSNAEQYLAIHVDEVYRNEEIPVKEIGPQLSRAPGVTGASIGGDGRALLIVNPLELAARHDKAQRRQQAAQRQTLSQTAPLVLVVDDSVTVRKVTSRLLQRAGYRVNTAKDGLEALDHLRGERPVAVLLDIEMPRMDGFELARLVRADHRLAGLPLIMISSRTAEKHRKHAQALGVNEFLGKPYHEDELLAHVERYRASAGGHAGRAERMATAGLNG